MSGYDHLAHLAHIAEQAESEHKLVARVAASFYRDFVEAGLPEALAHDLVRDWHREIVLRHPPAGGEDA